MKTALNIGQVLSIGITLGLLRWVGYRFVRAADLPATGDAATVAAKDSTGHNHACSPSPPNDPGETPDETLP